MIRNALVDLALVVALGGGALAAMWLATGCDCDDAPACAVDAPTACEPTGQAPTCDDDGCCSCVDAGPQ